MRSLLLCLGMWMAAPAPAQQEDSITVSRGTLDGYAGRYVLASGGTLLLWREGDVLVLQIDGGSVHPLVPLTESRFKVSGMDATLGFGFDAANAVDHLRLRQGGADVIARRRL
ncbi:MAG: hypothetical protein ABW178_07030 [Pseudoxanthomonas sp.]